MKIKFSHVYQKLLDRHNDVIESAKLLSVQTIELQYCHQSFLDYDTDNGKYELPKKGQYLMLLFLKPHESFVTDKNLFTTLRRYTPQKHKYYLDNLGKDFEVEITPSPASKESGE